MTSACESSMPGLQARGPLQKLERFAELSHVHQKGNCVPRPEKVPDKVGHAPALGITKSPRGDTGAQDICVGGACPACFVPPRPVWLLLGSS